MIRDSEIRRYYELMEEMNLSGIEVAEGDVKIRLERHLPPCPPPFKGEVFDSQAAASAKEALDVITSPMIGVFYSSGGEGEAPFVSVGDKIKMGDTICIIEAMKLMNEITADKEGTIAEICVKDGDVVDFGTPLFKIS